MSDSYKKTVEQFTEIINARHVNHLDKVLEENVEKSENSKVIYKNIEEAREYYSMEHEAHPSENFLLTQFGEEDQDNHRLTAILSYNKHDYATTYTFSPLGKIQKINSILQEQH
ncbi:unnamed protein product [Rotaria sordida]|uniref:Uncharacterized protein n=1 Tax=Rotaria sordida TaxID=392033 RepID=A0A819YQ84_9BILA|nr:unnamed protein product [Rotaria sordida]CAF1419792.1 unnamed protein product [Rotaria sordida]CAF1435401.1 unnamed protein product [Rotaria sordida]CAF1621665.1 unnamed protein product [Rotaria sordida]CAF4161325.1 unnamed protein product [Rotaria sordida]